MGAVSKRILAETISEELGFSVRVSLHLVDSLFQVMKDALQAGETIKIVRFGSLKPVKRPARKGIDPTTKKPITIPARETVSFHPSRMLKKQVNGEQNR